jgi:hypothetical protein
MSEFSVFGQYANEIQDWVANYPTSQVYVTKDKCKVVVKNVREARIVKIASNPEMLATCDAEKIADATRMAKWAVEMLQQAGKYEEIAAAIPRGQRMDEVTYSYKGKLPQGGEEAAAYCQGQPLAMFPYVVYQSEKYQANGRSVEAGSYDMAYVISSFIHNPSLKLPEIEDVVIHITKGEGLVVEHTLDGVVPCFVVAYGDELVTYNIYGSSDRYGSVSEFK